MKYTSIYRDEVVENGDFQYFDRVLDDYHFSHGYWCFHTEGQGSDDARAYHLGFRSPEAILISHLRGWGSPEAVQLCWVPGGEDAYQIPRQGTAKEHLQSIAEERQIMNLGNLGNDIPVYPIDPTGLLLKHRKIKCGTKWQLPWSPLVTTRSPTAVAPPARAARACNDALVQKSANRTGCETNHAVLNIGGSKHKDLIVKLHSHSLSNHWHNISQSFCPRLPPKKLDDSIMDRFYDDQMDSPASGRPVGIVQDVSENGKEQDYWASTPSDDSSNSEETPGVEIESSSSASGAPGEVTVDNESEEQAPGHHQDLGDEHNISSHMERDAEDIRAQMPFTPTNPNDSELVDIQEGIDLLGIDDSIDPDPLVSIMPCMDCDVIGDHALDCHLATINLLEPDQLNVLQLEDIANAVEYFDPEQWREHRNPPPPPPPEDPEVVWRGMAEIVRNEQAYKDDSELNKLELSDEQLVLLFIFRTTPGIECEIIHHEQDDENEDGDTDSQGIGTSDAGDGDEMLAHITVDSADEDLGQNDEGQSYQESST